MKLAAYLRISRDDETSSSLDVQREAIRRFCELYSDGNGGTLEIAAWFTDESKSGGKPMIQRDGAAKMLKGIDAGKFDGVIASKLDRLSRSLDDRETLSKLGEKGGLFLVYDHVDTRNASGKFILSILLSAAVFERERIGERVTENKAHKRSKGEYCGGHVRFGYRKAGSGFEQHPTEYPVLAEALRLAEETGDSWQKVANELNRCRMFARSGRWSPSKIKRTVAAERRWSGE